MSKIHVALLVLGFNLLLMASPATAIKAKVDFNGDGRADLLWRNSTNGDLFIWLMNGLPMPMREPAPVALRSGTTSGPDLPELLQLQTPHP